MEEMKIVRELLSFGQAIEALKRGGLITREGWNGKGMFVFQQVPSEVPITIVDKMKSLPQAAKDVFKLRFILTPKINTVKYSNQLAIVYPDNSIYGWVASPSDILANDWIALA
ncbi:hypothetical protein AUW17_05255 [Tenacibaculum dicentrarchi]|nr:hypothetical protein AUW17_03120 [Tenacibaculum dicentrarchi]ALU74711.1 hypothetical protein AUW17_05255 [Tenacibaculum dicentrarchi]